MKKVTSFLMGETRYFTVPRWKIIMFVFVLIVAMLILFVKPRLGMLIVLSSFVYVVYNDTKKMGKEEFMKHTKNVLKMVFMMGGMIISFVFIWMVLISPIIILLEFPPHLLAFIPIPRQFLFAIFFVLAFLMLSPAGAIGNLLWERFIPKKKEAEETENKKADKVGEW